MTTEELRIEIANVPEPNWFNNLAVHMDFPKIRFSQDFVGFSTVYDFVQRQIDGWDKLGVMPPQELKNAKARFESIRKLLIVFFNGYKDQDQRVLTANWNNTRSQIESQLRNVLPYDAPETIFLIEVLKTRQESYQGAAGFIMNDLQGKFNDRNDVVGVILAYEFIKNGKVGALTEENELDKTLERSRSDFSSFFSKVETQVAEFIQATKKKSTDYVNEIDEIKANKEFTFDSWFTNSKNEFTAFDTDSKTKINDLEKAYDELLKLKKPAEYWKERAKVLNEKGDGFRKWLFIFLSVGIALLFSLLWLTPKGLLESMYDGDKALAIRWSIIFIVFISLLFLGVRYIARSMFSSYHLARDAEERVQLMFVYLAMIKDSAVDEKDKHLIMQSLFSRADTGLLKEDSSPTMPSGIDKIIK